LDSCDVIGGLASPPIASCHQEFLDSCSSFKREECVYTGRVMLDKSPVVNKEECQQLLVTLGSIYGAVYFSYDSRVRRCILYDSKAATCDSFSGPDKPNLEDCQYVCNTVLR
jgi:hypothetical protein